VLVVFYFTRLFPEMTKILSVVSVLYDQTSSQTDKTYFLLIFHCFQ